MAAFGSFRSPIGKYGGFGAEPIAAFGTRMSPAFEVEEEDYEDIPPEEEKIDYNWTKTAADPSYVMKGVNYVGPKAVPSQTPDPRTAGIRVTGSTMAPTTTSVTFVSSPPSIGDTPMAAVTGALGGMPEYGPENMPMYGPSPKPAGWFTGNPLSTILGKTKKKPGPKKGSKKGVKKRKTTRKHPCYTKRCRKNKAGVKVCKTNQSRSYHRGGFVYYRRHVKGRTGCIVVKRKL